MSGYLERMVARVKAPAAGIRPLVRPLFAPPASDRPEGMALEETVHGSAVPPVGESSRQMTAPANPAAARVVESPSTTREARGERGNPAEAASARPVFEPLMPVVESSSVASQEEPSAFARAVTKESLERISIPAVQAKEPVFQPLMPAAPMIAARANATPAIPVAAPPAMDEIQIHIGRIEINAVPPPAAPRPVTGRPNRAVGLDDYLRRGSGRAR